MKLMNIILLFGLINNSYSMNNEFLLKIKTLWNYFTPEAQREIKKFLHNEDLTSALNDINPKVFLLLGAGLSEDDRLKIFHIANRKLGNEIFNIENYAKSLLDKGFTEEQVCNQLFSKVLNKSGCKAMGTIEHAHLKEMIIALKAQAIQTELNDLFNDEEAAK